MDAAQWPQGIRVGIPMESSRGMSDRKARPQKDQALNCPRCNSTNTKFCYYNNYSLSQPRYFCKTCRRFWTEGGSLRNIPGGGGSRKNKRSISSSFPPVSSKKLPDLTIPGIPHSTVQNPKIHEGQNLNLDYHPSICRKESNCYDLPNPSSLSPSSNHLSAMELLRSTEMTTKGLSSFMSIPVSDSNTIYPIGFPLQEFKPTLNFSLEGLESERLLFSMDDLKQGPNNI